MNKQPPPVIYAVFILYFALHRLASDTINSVAATAANAAAGVFSFTLHSFITNRAIAAFAGIVLIAAAAASVHSRITKRKSVLDQARVIVKFTFAALMSCLGIVAILLTPALDTTYTVASTAILVVVRIASPHMCIRRNGAITVSNAALSAGLCFCVIATAAAFGALTGRTHLLFTAIAAAAVATALAAPLPATAPKIDFTLLSIACLIGANGFINMPPAPLCKSWKPNARVRMVIDKPDAFDLLTARDGTMYITFKDGTVMKRERGGEIQTVRLDAPAQRLVLSETNNRLYVAAYKSRNPLVIIDTNSFRIAGATTARNCAATSVALSDDEKHVYFNCEAEGKVIMADAADGRIERESSLPRGTNIYSIAYANRTLYAVSSSLSPMIYALDARTLGIIKSTYAGFGNQGIAVDRRSGRLYVTRVFAARADVYDLATFKRIAYVTTGVIPRDIQPVGVNTVLTGSYAGGEARLTGVGGAAIKWNLPQRVRGVWSDASGTSYAACSCGIVELQ